MAVGLLAPLPPHVPVIMMSKLSCETAHQLCHPQGVAMPRLHQPSSQLLRASLASAACSTASHPSSR